MEFRLGSEERWCRQGDVVVVPGGTEHEAWFREDAEVTRFFPPPRDDFLLGGKPAYINEAEQVAPSSHRQGDVQFARRGAPRCERGSCRLGWLPRHSRPRTDRLKHRPSEKSLEMPAGTKLHFGSKVLK